MARRLAAELVEFDRQKREAVAVIDKGADPTAKIKWALDWANYLLRTMLHEEAERDMSQAQLEYLLEETIPATAQACLSRRQWTAPLIDITQQYLHAVVRLAVALVAHHKLARCMEVVDDMLSSRWDLYHYEKLPHDFRDDPTAEPSPLAPYMLEGSKVDVYRMSGRSMLMVTTLRVLVDEEDFCDVVLRALETSPSPSSSSSKKEADACGDNDDAASGRISCENAALLLTPALHVARYLTPEQQRSWADKVKAAVAAYLDSFVGDDVRNMHQKSFDDLVYHVQLMLYELDEDEGDEWRESTTLHVALQWMRSPILEKRNAGLAQVLLLAEGLDPLLNPPPVDAYSGSAASAAVEAPAWLTQELLVQWLTDNKVLEYLYGSNLRIELLNKAVSLLVFLARRGALTAQLLDTVWSASVGVHETITRKVYENIGLLVAHLSREHVLYLWAHIERLPHAQWGGDTINLVSSFSWHALATNHGQADKRWFGLDLLWSLVQDDVTTLSDTLKWSCFSMLERMFSWQSCWVKRVDFLEAAVAKIQAGQCVNFSLRLIGRIISTYPPEGTQDATDTIASVTEWLNTECNLLATVLGDLQSYTASAAASADSVVSAADVDEATRDKMLNEHFFRPIMNHFYTVSELLNLLEFILINSSLELTTEQAGIVWDCFCVNGLTPAERDLGFDWFAKVHSDQSTVCAFSEATSAQLFEHRVASLNLVDLPSKGFGMVRRLFLWLNQRRGKLRRLPSSVANKADDWLVLDMEVLGVDTLWRIAMTTASPAVGRQAIAMLTSLQRYVHASLGAQLAAYRNGFVATCMQRLAQAVDTAAGADGLTPSLQLVVVRCLAALTEFVKVESPRTGGSEPKRITVKGMFVGHAEEGDAVAHLVSTDTVGALRAAMAKATGRTQGVRIISGGKELKADHETLAQHRVGDGTKVHLLDYTAGSAGAAGGGGASGAANAGAPKSADVFNEALLGSDTSAAPTTILTQAEHFDRLFAFFELSSQEVAKAVWQLVSLLPPSPVLRRSYRNPDASNDWDQLLVHDNTYKLYYQLRIVQGYNDGSSLDPDRPELVHQWRQAFVQSTGVRRLGQVLSEANFFQGCTVEHQCHALLLRVASSFVLDPDHSQPALAPRMRQDVNALSPDAGALVSKLMHNIYQVAQLSHAGATDDASATAEGEAGEGDAATAASTTSSTSDSDAAAKLGMRLLVAMTRQASSLMQLFVANGKISSWLEATLLSTSSGAVRTAVSQGLCHMADTPAGDGDAAPASVLLRRVAELADQVDAHAARCEQYFDTLCHLVRTAGAAASESSPVHELLTQLCTRVSGTVMGRDVVEQRFSDDEDKVLSGHLQLGTALVQTRPSAVAEWAGTGLVAYLFGPCLFDIPTIENHGPLAPPLCKRGRTRAMAFELLTALCCAAEPRDDVVVPVLQRLQPLHMEGAQRDKFRYSPDNLEKDGCGYVGLLNLGATCYMNSLMQQLFMQPEFRMEVFHAKPASVEVPADATPEERKAAQEAASIPEAEDVLFQLQYLYAMLQEGEQRYYTTRPFVKAYGLNPAVQQDVDEFMNMLFDRLERILKGTMHASVFKRFFGGTLMNQIISQECEHVSERQEDFFALSLDVKGKASLEESLASYIKGDLLSGENKYQCSQCNTKVDAVKRVCLDNLPTNLIVHLKRFDFDFETLMRAKVNGYCAFPSVLDLEPFTRAGLAKREKKGKGNAEAAEGAEEEEEEEAEAEAAAASDAAGKGKSDVKAMDEVDPGDADAAVCTQFRLVGVLVHTGTTDSGHYYSFAQERIPLSGSGTRRWLKLNDDDVEWYDPARLEHDTFGGSESYRTFNQVTRKYVTGMREKRYSGYMLFYERLDHEHDTTLVDQAASHVPPAILQDIWTSNTRFLHDKNTFSPEYAHFLWRTIGHVAQAPEASEAHLLVAAQTGLRFLVDVLCHAKDKSGLKMYVKHVRTLLTRCHAAAEWMLLEFANDPDHQAWLDTMMFLVPDRNARAAFSDLVVHALRLLAPQQAPHYDDSEPLDEDMQDAVVAGATDCGDADATPEPCGVRTHHLSWNRFYMGEPVGRPRTAVATFMDAYVRRVASVAKHWKRFGAFWRILDGFVCIGPAERAFMLKRGYLSFLVDFYLGEKSPHAVPGAKVVAIREKNKRPDVSALVSAVRHLVCHCDLSEHAPAEAPMPVGGGKAEADAGSDGDSNDDDDDDSSAASEYEDVIPDEGARLEAVEWELVTSRKFVVQAMKDSNEGKALGYLGRALCCGRRSMWESWVLSCVQVMSDVDGNRMSAMMTALIGVLSLCESPALQEARVELAMTKITQTALANKAFPKSTCHTVRWLATMSNQVPCVRSWLFNNIDKWLPAFLFQPSQEETREAAERLVYSLCPEVPPLSRDDSPSSSTASAARPGSFVGPLLPGSGSGSGSQTPKGGKGAAPRVGITRLSQAAPAGTPIATDRTPEEAEEENHVAAVRGYSQLDVFRRLLAHLDTVSRCSVVHKGTVNTVKEEEFTSLWRLVQYFRCLRWCVRGPDARELFPQCWESFWALFTEIDGQRHEIDLNKLELMRFWHAIVLGAPTHLLLIVKDPVKIPAFADYALFVRTAPNTADFNNRSLQLVYDMFVWLFANSADWHTFMLSHANFNWYLRNLWIVPVGHLPDVYPLMRVCYERLCANREYRVGHAQWLVKEFAEWTSPKTVLFVLEITLMEPPECKLFCAAGGLNMMAHLFELLPTINPEDLPEWMELIKRALVLLNRVTSWVTPALMEEEAGGDGLAVDVASNAGAVLDGWETAISQLLVLLQVLPSMPPDTAMEAYQAICLMVRVDESCANFALDNLARHHQRYHAAGGSGSGGSPAAVAAAAAVAAEVETLPVHRQLRALRSADAAHVAAYYNMLVDVAQQCMEAARNNGQVERMVQVANVLAHCLVEIPSMCSQQLSAAAQLLSACWHLEEPHASQLRASPGDGSALLVEAAFGGHLDTKMLVPGMTHVLSAVLGPVYAGLGQGQQDAVTAALRTRFRALAHAWQQKQQGGGSSGVVVRPLTTEEVAQLMTLCSIISMASASLGRDQVGFGSEEAPYLRWLLECATTTQPDGQHQEALAVVIQLLRSIGKSGDA